MPDDAIRFVGPGEPTRRALGIWGMNKEALERARIFDLRGLSEMDTHEISRQTDIRIETLEELKSMANREIRYLREEREST